MYVVNFNSSGITSVAYSRKDSKCNYHTENEAILARCQIQIYSYGTERQVSLRPLGIEVDGKTVDFEPKVVTVRPRGQVQIDEAFEGFVERPHASYENDRVSNIPLRASSRDPQARADPEVGFHQAAVFLCSR